MNRRSIIYIVVVVAILCGSGSSHAHAMGTNNTLVGPSTLYSGLTAWWTFDGPTVGPVINDLTGNGRVGYVSGATTTVAGRIGQALGFDGATSYMWTNTLSGSVMSNTVGTMSIWVYPQAIGVSCYNGSCGIMTDGDRGGGGGGNIWIGIDNNSKFTFGMADSTASNFNFTAASASALNHWYHLVWVHNGTSLIGYVNGVQVVTGTPGNGTVNSMIPRMSLGISYNSSLHFKGYVDDARIYNRALSPQEVVQLYNATGGLGRSNVSLPVSKSPSSSGLVAWWTLDGNNLVNNVSDSSGNGYNGYLTGFTSTSSAVVAGKIGQAMNFNGTTNYINANSLTTPLASGSFTISVWVKLAAPFTPSSANMSILRLGDSPSTNDIDLCFNNSGGWGCAGASPGSVCFTVSNGSSMVGTCTPQTSWAANTWYHIVGVMNTVSGGKTLYINGVATSTETTTARGSTPSASAYVGASWNFVIQYYFNGVIDDFRAYNRALSAAEVKQLYMSTRGERTNNTVSGPTNLKSGLVGWWTMDGVDTTWTSGTTGTVADKSGSGNTATLTGMFQATAPTSGRIGQAMKMNGTGSSYLLVNDSTPLKPALVSLSAWVLVASSSPTASTMIIAKDHSTASFGYFIKQYSNQLIFGSNNAQASVTQTPYIGRWIHIVGTYDGSYYRLYINGTLVNTSSLNTTALDYTGNLPLYIGGYGNAGAGYINVNSIDDVRIYNRALSAAEVKELYMMGK